MAIERVGKGIVRRSGKRVLGLFIDGAGLDRACRRLNRRIDLAALVRGVSSGLEPVVARYYTLIPHEDDSRHRAFLDAVARAGLTVVVKRLPPKGITRQVTTDIELSADIMSFALGNTVFSKENEYLPAELYNPDEATRQAHRSQMGLVSPEAGAPKELTEKANSEASDKDPEKASAADEKRVVTVVCPNRDVSYPLSLCKVYGVDTVSADFGEFQSGNVLKSAAKWIDLSGSETIWKE